MESPNLSGQVAVVTGGAKGVGRLFAEELVRAGAGVAIVGRNAVGLESAAQELRRNGGTVLPLVADVTDRAASRAALTTVQGALGPIDLLVNNAGVANLGRVSDVDPDFWWEAFEINLKAMMQWCQDVLPSMTGRGSGRIVNVTSSAAQWTVAGGSAYIASKAGVSGFTRVLNAELRKSGVLAFAIAPHLKTDMTDLIQSSPAIPAGFRAAAQAVTEGELQARRRNTVALFRRIIAGELDHHAGEHLETEAPPS